MASARQEASVQSWSGGDAQPLTRDVACPPLGVTKELTSRITRFDRPRYFRERCARGVQNLATITNSSRRDGDRMRDVFEFTRRGGFGWLASGPFWFVLAGFSRTARGSSISRGVGRRGSYLPAGGLE